MELAREELGKSSKNTKIKGDVFAVCLLLRQRCHSPTGGSLLSASASGREKQAGGRAGPSWAVREREKRENGERVWASSVRKRKGKKKGWVGSARRDRREEKSFKHFVNFSKHF